MEIRCHPENQREGRTGDIAEAFKGVDAVVAASKPGPNTIKKNG
jgi:hypothetical protein